MMRELSFTISPTEFSPDAKFAFKIMFFGTEVVKVQNFSDKNHIRFRPEKPGLYSVEALIIDNNSLKDVGTPFTYLEPDKVYHLEIKNEKSDFIRSVQRAYAHLNMTAYKAEIGEQKFDFLYFPSREKRLFILCPSAIIRGKFLVPYFYRWSWARDGIFPGNVLVVSDPTFDIDNKIEAGWFIGEKDKNATKNFCSIIKIFNSVLNIPYAQTVFWGSSAGGFIALQMSKYFPGSKAVAINAQMDIDKYPHNGPLYEISFKGLSREEINLIYNERLRIAPNMNKLKSSQIIIVQNIQDTHHYEKHFLPFASSVLQKPEHELTEGIYKKASSPFTFWVYSHPEGHMAETSEMTQDILKMLDL